ncbi:MAG: hypothetical protein O3C65_14225 [Proteobacteria bacterium]|nr:hypothetical protein [Pseudomonadota bacterium]
MNKTTLTLLSAVCLTALAVPALAAGPQGMRGGHHAAGHGGGVLETFDTNNDGRLTQAEIDTFRADRLAKFDSDNNGTLSLKEYEALWLDAYRERMVDEFQRHDDDGDSVVTAEEFNEPYAKLVARMDRNGDGILTGEELNPRRHRDASAQRGARMEGEHRGPRMDDDDDE